MKSPKKGVSLMLLLIGCWLGLHAQEALPATGGESIGTGGAASFTLGQIAYTVISSADGQVSLGVQQSYTDMQVSTTDPISEFSFHLFPNPVTNIAYLELLSEQKAEGIHSWSVYTIHGTLMKSGSFSTEVTAVSLESLPTGMYMMSVSSPKNFIATTKLVKTDSP